jgi:hypothetical protein
MQHPFARLPVPTCLSVDVPPRVSAGAVLVVREETFGFAVDEYCYVLLF